MIGHILPVELPLPHLEPQLIDECRSSKRPRQVALVAQDKQGGPPQGGLVQQRL